MGKNILLGITGGIAAYKTAAAASALTKQGHNVFTVMTESACEFISPLTFQSLTGNPVEVDMFSPPDRFEVKHISLADRADITLVAPATGNFIGKLAGGIADDLFSTIIMATRSKVLIAPAMNVNMYEDVSFQRNLSILKERGYQIIEPESGYLACGYEGTGRMPEAEMLVKSILSHLTISDLDGLKFLVTAGPTREPLDPVRFMSNYSSGRMGYALADRAAARGAEVTLISGPTALKPPAGVRLIRVEQAREMQEAVLEEFADKQVIIMAAAVADYRPADYHEEKIKKQENNLKQISLKQNPDILTAVREAKAKEQILVGFAAESGRILEKARDKYQRKAPDILVVNDISRSDRGFAAETNAGFIFTGEEELELTLRSKTKFAEAVLDEIKDWL